jgi:UDP-3-O-[3-hydroxymyristoyl] N-acetylglucosamine deacetylase
VAYATQLRSGEARVETVEHLLAALVSAGVDNAIVELNTPEVPIMDGSSAPFIFLVQEAGVKVQSEPRRYLKVTEPVTLSRGAWLAARRLSRCHPLGGFARAVEIPEFDIAQSREERLASGELRRERTHVGRLGQLIDQLEQVIPADRLRDEMTGAGLHGFHGKIDAAIPGQHDNPRRAIHLALQ